jgi:molecular chaperone GrpE
VLSFLAPSRRERLRSAPEESFVSETHPSSTGPAEGPRAPATKPEDGVTEELRAELARALGELDQARKEREQQDRRLDEIARAYSGLLNDQKEFRQRLEREKDRVLESERGKVALALLELGDELERALAASSGDEGPLAKGVGLIREGLLKRLSAMGIERLNVVGQPFDPTQAEAVDLVPVTDPNQDDVVIAEATPGYRLGERVLRAARVRVARYSAPRRGEGPAAGPPTAH